MVSLDHLTDRQKQVYEFIRDKIHNRGYGPTVREIGEQFQISSPNGVMCHLRALEKKGLITRQRNKSRAIELVQEPAREERGLRLVGTVAAGLTTLVFEEQHDRIDFSEMFADQSDLFTLQVSGDSMIEAQIANDDYVVVRKQPTAESGQMVVAQTNEGEATLKFWFPEPEFQRIRLQPANSTMQPIYLEQATVIGVVVGVVRSL